MKASSGLLVLVATALFPAAVFAQDIAGSPAQTAKPVKEKKICRRQEITGSMLGTSICHTAAQWASIDEQNSQNAEALRNRSSQRPQ